MKKSRKDPVREDSIHNEAIADASPDEQALSWYSLLPGKQNPFPVPGNVPGCTGHLAVQER